VHAVSSHPFQGRKREGKRSLSFGTSRAQNRHEAAQAEKNRTPSKEKGIINRKDVGLSSKAEEERELDETSSDGRYRDREDGEGKGLRGPTSGQKMCRLFLKLCQEVGDDLAIIKT